MLPHSITTQINQPERNGGMQAIRHLNVVDNVSTAAIERPWRRGQFTLLSLERRVCKARRSGAGFPPTDVLGNYEGCHKM